MAKLRLLTSVAVMVAMLMAALPATAFAHTKARVECEITLFVTDPGADAVKEKKKHFKVKNSGQLTEGFIECFDESTGALVPSFSGMIATDHGSSVKLDKSTGEFKGKLQGKVTLISLGSDGIGGTADDQVLEGKISGKVEGNGVLVPGFAGPMFPDATLVALSETITGKMILKGTDIKVKGKFGVELVGGALEGEVDGDVHNRD